MEISKFETLKNRIIKVAEALGPDILAETAFVGGATTGLYINDRYTLQHIRGTDDVDLIISAIGYYETSEFEKELRSRGFEHDTDSDVICRKKLGEMIVDFMPTDESLGFTNRWYKEALAEAMPYPLTDKITIRLLQPIHFIATKFEAWQGRGENDLLSSRDIEDIMNLIDGRDSLLPDIKESSREILKFISDEFIEIQNHYDYESLLQSSALGDIEREKIIHARINAIIGLKDA